MLQTLSSKRFALLFCLFFQHVTLIIASEIQFVELLYIAEKNIKEEYKSKRFALFF